MTAHPLVSVVIPVYNGANYVGEAIESALAQTYRSIEVVVVDDGSTDGGATRKVVESFGDRVRYVLKPNGGVATALNAGIAHMQGELFSWLSHDDLYRPEKVERQVDVWRSFGQSCVVIGDFETMDPEGSPLHICHITDHNLIARPLDGVFKSLINGCTLLVPRDLFDRAGLFEPGLPTTQDYHLWYRMARLVPFVPCPHADVRQRVHPLQGSRHSSHLDEASRMFMSLIESTPVRLMEAYDGSELRFLMRTGRRLSVYPALRTYITQRIDGLMRSVRYAVAFCGEPGVVSSWRSSLRNCKVPPSQVLAVVPHAPTVRPPDGIEVIEAGSAESHDIVSAVERKPTEEYLVFTHADGAFRPEDIDKALEAMIEADADLVHPSRVPACWPELDGVVVRRDALHKLRAALKEGLRTVAELSPGLQATTYDRDRTSSAPADDDLRKALAGQARMYYSTQWPAAAVGKLLQTLLRPPHPVILYILHSWGGGAHTLLTSLMQAVRRHASPLVCYGNIDGQFCLSAGGDRIDMGLVFQMPDHMPHLVRVLRRAGVSRVDVHHTIEFEKHADKLLQSLAVPYDVTLVDYHTVATNPFLCSEDGQFAGEEALRRPVPLPLLRRASRAIAISRDVAARFCRICPGIPVIPARLWHEHGVRMSHVFPPLVRSGEPLRILIHGDIVPHKGQRTILDVAGLASLRGLPLQFHVVGKIAVPRAVREVPGDRLTLHGWQDRERLREVFASIGPHVGWLPSQAPETWSYALSELLEAGLPVVGTAHGAISERTFGRPYTWLLPRDSSAEDWVELFLALHASRLNLPARWADVSSLPAARDFYFGEYLNPAT